MTESRKAQILESHGQDVVNAMEEFERVIEEACNHFLFECDGELAPGNIADKIRQMELAKCDFELTLDMDYSGQFSEAVANRPRSPLTEHCIGCNDTGIFESGVCHCGSEMEGHSLYDNHSATEMIGSCPYCCRGIHT